MFPFNRVTWFIKSWQYLFHELYHTSISAYQAIISIFSIKKTYLQTKLVQLFSLWNAIFGSRGLNLFLILVNVFFCNLIILLKFHSGKKTPFIPHNVLNLVWGHCHNLAGYKQQDAHEFFISTLDILHRHSSGLHNKFIIFF